MKKKFAEKLWKCIVIIMIASMIIFTIAPLLG